MNRTLTYLESNPGTQVNPDICEAICLDIIDNVDADLVSIWLFDPAKSKITCLHSKDLKNSPSMKGLELFRQDFPVYFRSIVEETTINASNARTHPMTRELTKAYFEPFNITSLLDFIIHNDFEPVGVICCESRNRKREWDDDNIDYLRSLTTYISFETRF